MITQEINYMYGTCIIRKKPSPFFLRSIYRKKKKKKKKEKITKFIIDKTGWR